jgi:hypothetical protein
VNMNADSDSATGSGALEILSLQESLFHSAATATTGDREGEEILSLQESLFHATAGEGEGEGSVTGFDSNSGTSSIYYDLSEQSNDNISANDNETSREAQDGAPTIMFGEEGEGNSNGTSTTPAASPPGVDLALEVNLGSNNTRNGASDDHATAFAGTTTSGGSSWQSQHQYVVLSIVVPLMVVLVCVIVLVLVRQRKRKAKARRSSRDGEDDTDTGRSARLSREDKEKENFSSFSRAALPVSLPCRTGAGRNTCGAFPSSPTSTDAAAWQTKQPNKDDLTNNNSSHSRIRMAMAMTPFTKRHIKHSNSHQRLSDDYSGVSVEEG